MISTAVFTPLEYGCVGYSEDDARAAFPCGSGCTIDCYISEASVEHIASHLIHSWLVAVEFIGHQNTPREGPIVVGHHKTPRHESPHQRPHNTRPHEDPTHNTRPHDRVGSRVVGPGGVSNSTPHPLISSSDGASWKDRAAPPRSALTTNCLCLRASPPLHLHLPSSSRSSGRSRRRATPAASALSRSSSTSRRPARRCAPRAAARARVGPFARPTTALPRRAARPPRRSGSTTTKTPLVRSGRAAIADDLSSTPAPKLTCRAPPPRPFRPFPSSPLPPFLLLSSFASRLPRYRRSSASTTSARTRARSRRASASRSRRA